MFNNYTLWSQTFRKAPRTIHFLCRLSFTIEFSLSTYGVSGTVLCLTEDTAVKNATKNPCSVPLFYSSGQRFDSFSSWTRIFQFLCCTWPATRNACYVMILFSIMTHRKSTIVEMLAVSLFWGNRQQPCGSVFSRPSPVPGTKCLCEQEGPAGRGEQWGVAATDRTKLWFKWQVTLTAGEAAVTPSLPTGCAGHFCATCSLILRGELWLSLKPRGMECQKWRRSF